MTILLTCENAQVQQRWVLRPGELARVGKSDWVEFVVEGDSLLNDEHFFLDYRSDLVLKSIGGAAIESQGDAASFRSIDPGTRFRAGMSEFRVESIFPRFRQTSFLEEPVETKMPEVRWQDPILEEASLSNEGKEVLCSAIHQKEAIDALRRSDLKEDAIRTITWSLETSDAMRWSIAILEESEIAIEPSLRHVVHRWLDPSEVEERFESAATFPKLEHTDPWHWILQAITWASGSLAPPGCEPVAAPRRMIHAAIFAAMQFASVRNGAKDFRDKCIDAGVLLLERSSEV